MTRLEPPALAAHRAGNDPARLARARPVADLCELDVHLGRRGRLEVRHAKRLWPTARLWERWYLLAPRTPVPDVATIVGAAAGSALWFDLKGVSPRLARRVAPFVGPGDVVSSKSWWLLRPFRDRPGVRTFRSAGNRLELSLALHLPSRLRPDGMVVNQRLLDTRVLSRLRRRGAVVTWGITDPSRLDAQIGRAHV